MVSITWRGNPFYSVNYMKRKPRLWCQLHEEETPSMVSITWRGNPSALEKKLAMGIDVDFRGCDEIEIVFEIVFIHCAIIYEIDNVFSLIKIRFRAFCLIFKLVCWWMDVLLDVVRFFKNVFKTFQPNWFIFLSMIVLLSQQTFHWNPWIYKITM